ncbi:MFS transporter [Breoghania corrubedonensis]|nr:MFS transporter [Breoghania corrubedonensis]
MTVQAQLNIEAGDRLARRNALLLAVAQSVGGATASIVVALGGLAGHELLGSDKSFATLPVTFFVLGTACGTLPAGYIMRHLGRRNAYMGAAVLGGLGGLLACLGIIQASFVTLLIGTMGCGIAGAFVQSYRFAAADTASDAFRPKAISWVMAGGLIAGIVGPQTVIATKDMLAPIMFAGSFAAIAVLNTIGFCLVFFVRIPKPTAEERAVSGRPILTIIRQERFIVAVACGIGSYALMSFVMTATPLAMIACGHTQTDAALAIQWHVLAMYIPSFFTGSLIARFGKSRIVALGLTLLVGCGIVALSGVAVEDFWFALILLGLGWNFGFIGATSMVTDTYRPEERTKVQATNDFLVFGFVAMASFASGNVLNDYGWQTINWMLFPVVAFCLALLVWLAIRERRASF